MFDLPVTQTLDGKKEHIHNLVQNCDSPAQEHKYLKKTLLYNVLT
jgi:hypothetical protein